MGQNFGQLLNAVLEQGDGRLLSGMVLCAKTERPCSTQLDKGTISLSQTQNGEVIALLSFLGPTKFSSKLWPEWRVRTPSRQLEAMLKDSQLSLCVAQPQQGFPEGIFCPPQGLLLWGQPEVSKS